MKTKIALILCLLGFSAHADWLSLTNVRPPILGIGETLPTSMGKIITNTLIFSNSIANGTGTGGGSGLNSTNPIIWFSLTLTNYDATAPWVEWTGATNLPGAIWPTNATCTNASGPFYAAGNNRYTNVCGLTLLVLPPSVYSTSNDWQSDSNLTAQVAVVTNLMTISVSTGYAPYNGTYVFTNGGFWKGSVTAGGNEVYYNNQGSGLWTVRAGASSSSIGPGLYDGGFVTAGTNGAKGFPYAFVPGFNFALSGADRTNVNGVYHFSWRGGNPANAEAPIFTNQNGCSASSAMFRYTNGVYCYGEQASSPVVVREAGVVKYQRWYTTSATEWFVFGDATTAPRITYFTRPDLQTNAIVLVMPPSYAGTNYTVVGETPARLTYMSGTNCTYLSTAEQLWRAVAAMNTTLGTNSSALLLQTNGTAVLILDGSLAETIPQSNPQWKPCP